MADNAPTVVIRFGARNPADDDDDLVYTGSLWDYRYGSKSGLSKYSGSIDPIFGPECRIHSENYGCYAATTGIAGPESESPYDYVTLKPGQDTYVYMDVGFWGGSSKRFFGLVCGPHVWLCNFGRRGGAPEPTDPAAQQLSKFEKQMGNFMVVQHATVPLDHPDSGSQIIYLILPDMHMWPDPEVVKKRRKEFFDQDELKALHGDTKDDAHSVAAMKEAALSDPAKMKREEEEHAFGSMAGTDLERLLGALERARDKGFKVTLVHVGDLLEMWSPNHTWAGARPFKVVLAPLNESEQKLLLKLTDTAKQRIPRWLEMIYNYDHNWAALRALDNASCVQIYGNHDVYLAFNDWNLTKISTMDALRDSRGFFSDNNLLWIEHGHRFDTSNRDGYWLWVPYGPSVNTMVNYNPNLRNFSDRFDNPDKNLYEKNLPYATIWFLLAHHARVDVGAKSMFRLPPKFRIFCQGHTHVPVLRKVNVLWNQLKGHYDGLPTEQAVTPKQPMYETSRQ